MRLLLALVLLACPLWAQSVAVSGNAGVSGNVQVLTAPPSQQQPLNVTTASPMPAGDEGVAYSELLAAVGGVTPYVWTLVPGDPLPPGLFLAGGGESLADPGFDLAEDAAWAAGEDFSITGGAAVYAHSTGTGSLVQGPNFLAQQLLPGATYDLDYTVSGSAGNPVCIIPTIPATTNVALDETNGAHSVSFTAHATPTSFAVSCTSDSGDDAISFTVVALEQQTGIGTIFGTPTAPGTYPFTVRVTDAQPVFDTQALSIVVDPAAPAGGLIFTSDGPDMTPWVSAGGSSITLTGLVDGDEEITKTTATDSVMVDNIDAPEVWVACDVYRSSSEAPDTSVDSALKIVDSSGTILGRWRIESDWDIFAFTPGQTTFNNRGFFLQPLAAATSMHIQVHYLKGTGADALWEVRVNGGSAQSFNAGTATANVDRVMLSDANDDAAQDFVFDRCRIRTDTWEVYTPPVPSPPTVSGNCLNADCVTATTVPSGADRLLAHACAAEGADRATASVSSSVDGALTSAGSHDANGCHVSLWVKLGATVGAHTMTATFPTGSDDVEASCQSVTLTGISSATAEATATDSEAASATISTPITTTTTDAAILSAMCGSVNGTSTPTSPQVEFFDLPGGAGSPGMFGTGSTKLLNGAAGAKTVGYTASGSMALTVFAAAFPIVAAVQGTPFSFYGGECNATADDAPELQTALNDCNNWANGTLIFPAASTCRLAEKVVVTTACSNKTILGQGATMKAGNGLCGIFPCGVNASLVDIRGTWINPTFDNWDFDGNRANRTGGYNSINGDNFRCGSCRGVTIRNMNSRNAPNDNLRVHALVPGDTNSFPRDWTVIDSVFENPGRNAASVIEGWRINFVGTRTGTFDGTATCQFNSANGGDPESGLGLEPNANSAVPAVSDVVVDGCLFLNNAGTGQYSGTGGGSRNLTVRNSIFRGNGTTQVTSHRGHIRTGSYGFLAEGNYFKTNTGGCRFAHIYVNFGGCSGTPPVGSGLSAARCSSFQNNFMDGQSPVCGTGLRHILSGGNFGSGATASGNAMTNIGVSASGDWCRDGPSLSTIIDNTVDAVTQVPNPGCP